MHSLHFVHIDIKPANLMYSTYYRRPVFIDFGLSKLIPEEKGAKTLTHFTGSINFCSM